MAVFGVYSWGPANEPVCCSIYAGYFRWGPDSRPDEKGIETFLEKAFRHTVVECPDSRPDEKGIETVAFACQSVHGLVIVRTPAPMRRGLRHKGFNSPCTTTATVRTPAPMRRGLRHCFRHNVREINHIRPDSRPDEKGIETLVPQLGNQRQDQLSGLPPR